MVGAGFLALAALTACSGGGAEPADPADGMASEPSKSSGPEINDPKDAAAVDACSLLPAETATSLGLSPKGTEEANSIDSDAPAACAWRRSEDGMSVSLTALGDRSIQDYYENKAKYSDYEELTIAGHPAVRANQGDPKQDSYCDFFLATKNGQVLAAQATQPSKVDPCGLAKKALEASVPTLPTAK